MKAIKDQYDPHGLRAIGCRSLKDDGAVAYTEYFGIMVGQDAKKDKRTGPTDTFRSFSEMRRDMAPFIETEDFRDAVAKSSTTFDQAKKSYQPVTASCAACHEVFRVEEDK